jgi:hypothetical protein
MKNKQMKIMILWRACGSLQQLVQPAGGWSMRSMVRQQADDPTWCGWRDGSCFCCRT